MTNKSAAKRETEERTHDGHYTKRMLGTRGWTPTAIQELLGEPDQVRRLYNTPGAVVHIYYRERVKQKERTKRFTRLRDAAAAIKAKRQAPAESLQLTVENIAKALYCVNKSAKRRAEGAQKSYRARAHSMAGLQKTAKVAAYELKNEALIAARKFGLATLARVHRHRGTLLACWRVGKFTFHQPVTAAAGHVIEDLPDEWQSPRVPLKGMRVKQAGATLEALIRSVPLETVSIEIAGLDETFPLRRGSQFNHRRKRYRFDEDDDEEVEEEACLGGDR